MIKVKSLPVTDLYEDPANVRSHSERNLEAIKGSLQRFGQQKPIVIDKNKVVRAGNGTLAAAKQLGWEKISCVESNLESAELTAYAIADNRTAELANWNDDELAQLLKELDSTQPDLFAATGFSESELSWLMQEFNADTEPPSQLDEKTPNVVTCPKCLHEFET